LESGKRVRLGVILRITSVEKKFSAFFLSVLLLAMFSTPFVVNAAISGGTTLIMGTTDSVESAIDPARAYDFFGWEIIQNTGCTLVEIEPGSAATAEDYNPALAANWTTSTDGKTWTFTLREGVLFEDGTEFNASHVKYSFDRNMGINHPDGPQLNMQYDAIIDNVEVVSKYVVKFNLKIPFAPFLWLMVCQASAVVNPAYAGGWKTDWSMDDIVWYMEGDARASSPMDLGPYKLTNWTRVAGKDHEMRLEANPNYWNKDAGLPKTDVVVIKFYADATALRLAIEAGDVDVAFRHLSATDIEDLQDDPDLKVWEGTGAAIQYMIFQEDPVGTLPQLDNANVRRALTACLDRPEVTSTVFLGQASPLYSIIPTGMTGHTEAFKVLGDANYTYARSVLADLGYNETNKLQIELWYESSGHYPSSAEQAAVYKSQFEASNVISVTLKSADWPSYRENRNEGVMHVFLLGWYPDYIDPDNYAFLYYASWLHHNYAKYNATNSYIAMKDAYDAARAATDETERIALYAEIDDYAVMDCPVVPLWQGKAYAVTKPDVQGVYLDVTESWRMWYLYAESALSPPVASFAWEPEKPYVGDSVVFDASASYDPDGIIVRYYWDFGDGTTANTTDPIVEHIYNQNDTYTVTLNVTDNNGLTNAATAHIEVIHRLLSVKLTGEFDYMRMEQVRIRLAALVRYAETMGPVSNAAVNVEIYDSAGKLWVSVPMLEKISGSGIYEWASAGTIGQLRLSKGVYLVRASASFRGGPTAYDILEFHIDPPQEQPIELKTIVLLTLIGIAGILASFWYIDHRRLTRKLYELQETKH